MEKPPDLSEDYWGRLSERHQALYLLVRPQPKTAYSVDVSLNDLESFLGKIAADQQNMGGSFELEPDFQRGHVWTVAQRAAYMEAILRGTAPIRIIFNCPGWLRNGGSGGDIPEQTFQCVDGLQRLTAVRQFLADEFTIFQGLTSFRDKPRPSGRGRIAAVHEVGRKPSIRMQP